MTTPATTPAPQKITPDCQPVFPCWLFCRSFRGWRHASAQRDQFADDTHWLPDQPTAPTCTPTEGEKPYAHSQADGNSPDFWKRELAHVEAMEPTHSAQEAAERAFDEWDKQQQAKQILADADCWPYHREYRRMAWHAALRHFPSTPTQSQQSPGNGEALREAIARLEENINETGGTYRAVRAKDIRLVLAAITPFLAQPATPPPVTPESIAAIRADLQKQIAIDCGEATPPLTSGEAVRSMELTHPNLKLAEKDLFVLRGIFNEFGSRLPKEDATEIRCLISNIRAAMLLAQDSFAPPLPSMRLAGFDAAVAKVEYWRDCHKGRLRSVPDNECTKAEINDLTELLAALASDRAAMSAQSPQSGREEK